MSDIKVKIGGYLREVESEEKLIELVREGIVAEYDPVFLPRMARWAHAQEIPELYEHLVVGRARFAERLAQAQRPWWKRVWDRLRGRN